MFRALKRLLGWLDCEDCAGYGLLANCGWAECCDPDYIWLTCGQCLGKGQYRP